MGCDTHSRSDVDSFGWWSTEKNMYRAPSWSWASRAFPTQDDGSERSLSWYTDMILSEHKMKDKAHAASITTTPVSDDPLGEISSGTLQLKGKCIRAAENMIDERAGMIFCTGSDGRRDGSQARELMRNLSLYPKGHEDHATLNIKPCDSWAYDGLDTDAPIPDILLMEVLGNVYLTGTPTHVIFLAFAPVGPDCPDIFERVGSGFTLYYDREGVIENHEDIFEEWGEEMTLTIV